MSALRFRRLGMCTALIERKWRSAHSRRFAACLLDRTPPWWLCTKPQTCWSVRISTCRCFSCGWVRRKELFCANMHLMNIHYHTNLNNLRQLAGSSRASLHFSLHIWLLAEAVAGQCVPALRWAVRQRRSRSHGLLFFFFFFLNRWGRQTTVSGARFLCRDASTPVTTDCAYANDLIEHHFVGAWTTDVIVSEIWKADRVRAGASGDPPRLRALFRAGAPGDSSPSRAFPRRGIRWLLAFARFPAQGHQAPSRAFSRRGIRWLLAFARFSAQGHQVTPRLRALFCAGAPGDSSPSRAFPRRGIRWLLAFTRFPAQGHHMTHCCSEAGGGSMSPWMSERAESSTHGSRWCGAGIMWMRECSLHTADRCRGAGIVWIREQCLPTRQPLMWGWYHVNERVSSTHGRPLSGAGIVWIREQCFPNTASCWWGAGIV